MMGLIQRYEVEVEGKTSALRTFCGYAESEDVFLGRIRKYGETPIGGARIVPLDEAQTRAIDNCYAKPSASGVRTKI